MPIYPIIGMRGRNDLEIDALQRHSARLPINWHR
jgi:hypothetical protein